MNIINNKVNFNNVTINTSSLHDYWWLDSLYTATTSDYFITKENKTTITINLKVTVFKNTELKKLTLFYMQDGDEIRRTLRKDKDNTNIQKSHWYIKFTIPKNDSNNLFSYRFMVSTKDHDFFWDAAGFYKYNITHINNFKYYYNSQQPDWLESAVIYHIFIDRFYKSTTAFHQNAKWGAAPKNITEQFFGGDILGIQQKLSYLTHLGINTLCLSPIFQSSSNHKYDTEDHYNIADCFGGNQIFKQFMQECHKLNIRIVLDGVFNHVSAKNKWFNRHDLSNELGAYQSQASIYYDYFHFDKHPDKYAMFWQEKNLPKLNYQSKKLREEVYQNDNAIIKHWLKNDYNTNGWRLDACCMLGKHKNTQNNSEVLSELYNAAKEQQPDCYIFGEHPFDPNEIIPYKHLDGITNYAGFYSPIRYWLNDSIDFNVHDFEQALKEFRVTMGYQFTLSSKTFLGNHDKQRLFTELNGDITKYLTALVFLFTYPGVPTLYYGEEIALTNLNTSIENKDQSDSRLCMKWENWTDINQLIFQQTQTFINIYKNNIALKKGDYRTLYCQDDVIVYARTYKQDCAIVLLVNTPKSDIADTKKTLTINIDFLDYYNQTSFINILENTKIKANNKKKLTVPLATSIFILSN